MYIIPQKYFKKKSKKMNEFKKENFNNYIKILLKWQKAINLISPKTIPFVWERHFKDSLFLYDYVKNKKNV
ncbi:MAG: class I SAM-dependent methyltransferase, partial [Alphaproteobacteria bacterium]|nr:class I SAM-dependent methyltransferase [Alphaproteobacteria bacterium]